MSDTTPTYADDLTMASMTSSRPIGFGPVRAYDWIAHYAANRPHHEAICDLGTGRSFTYVELDRRVDAMSAYLASLGIGRGDRVAVLAHNGVEFFDIQFACARTGSICVLLNWRLTVAELEFIISDSSPDLLVHDGVFTDSAQALQQRCSIRDLLAIEGGAPESPYEQVLSQFDDETVPRVHLNVLPLFHTGGLNCYSNPVLHAGGTVVIVKQFDPGNALALLGDPEQGITHFFAVPAPYQFMMQHPDFDNTDLSRLRIAGVGGAPCALSIMEAWAERGVRLAQGFGMTETSPASLFLDPADALRKIGSTGKALLHTEYRIVDEGGADCGPDEVGELWVAGPNITPGYWNRPDATADAFEGRWLKTGDAARVDGEGFVFIVDRWKDMYISGGENVYPAEIENVLYQLPQVSEAAVIGVPHDRWGEAGLAVLVLKPDATIDLATVAEHCVGQLARFKVPNDIAIVEALPRNATGKVLKRELRDRFVGSDGPKIS